MQIILVLETRASSKIDYFYIKSAIDYFYGVRSFKLTPIYAETKPELMKQDARINNYIAKYVGNTEIVVCADYDNCSDEKNREIIEYCTKHNYYLVWMNKDIEEVFLGQQIPKKDKNKAALDFLKKKDKILSSIDVLEKANPLEGHPASNLLIILDLLLQRKT